MTDNPELMPNTPRTVTIAEAENALRGTYTETAIEIAAEWAGILFDNPVCESYRQNHSDVEFTTEGLMDLTYKSRGDIADTPSSRIRELYDHYDDLTFNLTPRIIELALKEAERYERQDPEIKEFGRSASVEQIGRYGGGVTKLALAKTNPSLYELLSNPDTTLAELNEFSLRRMEKEAEYKEAKKARIRAILDDVRTGRASDPEYGVKHVRVVEP